MVKISYTENNLPLTGWHLGLGLFISMNIMVFLGLKLPWFKSRINIGRMKKDKHETVQVLGFKTFSEFPTYTSLSEFAPTRNYERPNSLNLEHRTRNPEVALKVHKMMNKSMTDLRTENNNELIMNNSTSETQKMDCRNDSRQNQYLENQDNESSGYRQDRNEYRGENRYIDENEPVEYNDDISSETEQNEIKPIPKQPKSILKKSTNYVEDPTEPSIKNGFNLLLTDPEPYESEWNENLHDDFKIILTAPESNKIEDDTMLETKSRDEYAFQPQIEYEKNQKYKRPSLMEELIFPRTENMYDDSNSARSDTPPSINYNTLPKSSFKPSTNYIYDLNKKYKDEPKRDDFQDIDLNDPTTEFNNKTLAEEMYTEQFKPYVIEVREGEDEYRPGNKQRTVHFQPAYDDDDDGEMYKIMERLEQENNSYDDRQTYDNDYTNTKRTSYFQTDNSKYSSQAANIFFGGKKPEPPPRRQIGTFQTTF